MIDRCPTTRPKAGDGSAPAPSPAEGHGWSDWVPIAGGLLERRCLCGCGSVERGTYDAVNGRAFR